ncbi:MAG: hypothetical protein KKA16_00580 [Alphaproteobacteria bacterium]|nr:hypothetical protein [Alphaproteobacteria bacterium]MBU2379332.1 hypothetical protein [Alphaproteobacteria bacterium]
MQMLSYQAFAGRSGETFDLAMGGSDMPLTLTEVAPIAAQPYPGMLREPFALIFRSASSVVLPQRIYRLKNAALGALDVFLVPVGREPGGAVYQAVFN